MNDGRPGLNPQRLVRLMRDAVERCQLELSGKSILTEAATGAYAVTPVLAALAGAEKVFAMTKHTRHGTIAEVRKHTQELARVAGVADAIEIITEKTQSTVAQADIITNSGHLRPIDSAMISWMKSTAVISLMYEGWEFRADDIDISACRKAGIRIVGTNERHPAIDVFSFLGITVVRLLLDAGVAVYKTNVLLLCDNVFEPFIACGLRGAGAVVDTATALENARDDKSYDAIIVALQPRPDVVLSAISAKTIVNRWPSAVVAQFWGDLDREAFLAAGVPIWPPNSPQPGHMGILLSAVGPEPIVRLQSGSLKAAEVVLRSPSPIVQTGCQFAEII